MELYKKYRPKTLDKIVGQDETVAVLEAYLKSNNLPHAVLLSGPSGCGKTTIVRILSKHLDCGESDFYEINGSAARGIDDIRKIESRMYSAPISGGCKVYYIDECHKLTNDAQNALLKPLEDTPSHVYFFLSTTSPDKIIATIKTRVTHLKLKSLKRSELQGLVRNIASVENIKIYDEVVEKIAETANGSARAALVMLDQIKGIKNEADQLAAIVPDDLAKKAYDLLKALLDTRTRWPEVCSIINSIEEDPENVRRVIISSAATILLKGKDNKKLYNIINAFRDHYYDSGKAGLVMSCYEVIHNL